MRLAVYIPQQSAAEQRNVAIEQLSAEGWLFEEAVTPITVGKTHVRYFHPQDREAAQDLAATLNSDARDFVSFTPSPDNGYLELWLGGPGAPPVVKPTITRGRMSEPYQALSASGSGNIQKGIPDSRDRDSSNRGDNRWLRPLQALTVFGRTRSPEDAPATSSGDFSARADRGGLGSDGSAGTSPGNTGNGTADGRPGSDSGRGGSAVGGGNGGGNGNSGGNGNGGGRG